MKTYKISVLLSRGGIPDHKPKIFHILAKNILEAATKAPSSKFIIEATMKNMEFAIIKIAELFEVEMPK
jgi:hypothetical protein